MSFAHRLLAVFTFHPIRLDVAIRAFALAHWTLLISCERRQDEVAKSRYSGGKVRTILLAFMVTSSAHTESPTDPSSDVSDQALRHELGPQLSRVPPSLNDRRQKIRRIFSFGQTVGFAFAIVALQLIQGILLARLLGPEGRGQYAAAVLYSQLLLYVGLMGGLEVICRYAADGSVSLLPLRRAAMWLGVTTGFVTMAVAIVFNLIALPDDKRFLIPLGCLCATSMIGQHVMLIMTAVDRGAGSYTSYNWRRLLAAASFPALLLGAAVLTEVSLTLACILFVGSSIVSMLACWVGVPNVVRGEHQPQVRRLLSESRPYGLSMLVTDLFERLDLVLVLWLTPLVTQGFYASMVPVAYPLTVIPNTLGIYLFNAGANQDKRLQRSDVHRIIGGSLLVQTLSTIVFLLAVGPLVLWVYGEDFAPAVIFAMWLAPVAAIKGILQGLDSYVKGRGRPLAVLRCRIVASLVMLVVTATLFPTYGAVAIAMSALVGQVVCLVWLSAIVYADVSTPG